MSRSIWRSVWLIVALLLPVGAICQETKIVYLRAMSREGKRVYFATESADLKTIRRLELAGTARVRLYFPRPPFGKLERKPATAARFVALFARKDKKFPQPVTLQSPFTITVRGHKITSLEQRVP